MVVTTADGGYGRRIDVPPSPSALFHTGFLLWSLPSLRRWVAFFFPEEETRAGSQELQLALGVTQAGRVRIRTGSWQPSPHFQAFCRTVHGALSAERGWLSVQPVSVFLQRRLQTGRELAV